MIPEISISLEDVLPQLDRLPENIAKKVLSQSLRAGAKVLQANARRNVPELTGKTKTAIRIRAGRAKKTNERSIIVGVGEQWFQGDEFYAAFVEFGHFQGSRKLKNRKWIEGEFWLRNSKDESEAAVISTVTAELQARIDDAELS